MRVRFQLIEGFPEMQIPSAITALTVKAESVVQQQLEAYNARDLEAWLATYKDDAEQYLLHGGLIASGHDAIRKRMADRFNDTALHAELVSRTVIDNVVVDHEFVTRTFPDGLTTVEMICIYEVQAGLIIKATFAIGQARSKK
jgi:hypothetical protein